METESRIGVSRSWGREEWKLLNGYRVFVLQNRKSSVDTWRFIWIGNTSKIPFPHNNPLNILPEVSFTVF